MPHIIVKLYKGHPDGEKVRLAEDIMKDVIARIGCPERAVSVAFEEFDQKEWPEKVYRPDILGNEENLVIKPGYNPFDS
jgi:phenylpyruvate tautomerase PptA (4-oxalocrotonate tautomerase family)